MTTSTDQVRRRAMRLATLVAVPAAVVSGAVSLWAYGAFDGPAPAASPTLPVQTATTPVTMAAPHLDEETARICRAMVAKLPDRIRAADRRPVSAGAEQNAAYGDPALTLACGTPPAALLPTTQVYPLAGVCWVAEASPGGATWRTVDRSVGVTVTVPGSPDGSGQAVVPLARAVAESIPQLPAPPTGCERPPGPVPG